MTGQRFFGRATEVATPSLRLADFPDFVEASAKRQEIRAKRTELEAEQGRITLRLQAADEADQHLSAQAEAMLAGHSFEPQEDPQTALRQVQTQLEVVRRAERLAKEAYDAVRQRRSMEICRALQPAHRERVRNIARLIGQLSDACEAEADIRKGLAEDGVELVASLIPEMHFPPAALGGWQGANSPASIWAATARRLGFLDADERLAEVRPGRTHDR